MWHASFNFTKDIWGKEGCLFPGLQDPVKGMQDAAINNLDLVDGPEEGGGDVGSEEAFYGFTNILDDRIDEVEGRQLEGRRHTAQVGEEQVCELLGESQPDSIHGHRGEVVDDGLGVERQICQTPFEGRPKIHLRSWRVGRWWHSVIRTWLWWW